MTDDTPLIDLSLTRQVEELVLIKCSLLPDEILEFILPLSNDLEAWTQVVDAHSEGDLSSRVSCPAQFAVKINGIPLWFEIELFKKYPLETNEFNITVRGYDISRNEQQRWQDIVQRKRAELNEADFPAYELISLQLLPQLHNEYSLHQASGGSVPSNITTVGSLIEPPFHALLTSHHLKSPQKRRSLQQWSSELRLCGFAKVGHPGVIYCAGFKSDVEEFVSKVKDMQWLALRIRFVEALPDIASEQAKRGSWLEVEKVGEVIDEMRRLGRENYVLDLGIGSGGVK